MEAHTYAKAPKASYETKFKLDPHFYLDLQQVHTFIKKNELFTEKWNEMAEKPFISQCYRKWKKNLLHDPICQEAFCVSC